MALGLPMQRMTRLMIASFVTSVSMVGCANQRDIFEAEQVIAHHFEARARRNYDTALADYDEHFFEDVTRSEWYTTLRTVTAKLGKFESYDINGQALDARTSDGPGTYLKFRCQVVYSKHGAKETFYMLRRAGAAKFKILAHEIDSPGFLSK